MGYRKAIIALLCLLIIPAAILAKSGAAIPIPRVQISEAIDIAGKYFYGSESRIKDADYFPKSEYVIISAEYSNYFYQIRQKDWAWKIKFVHPAQNDHSVIYKVTNDRKVIFIGASE